MRPRSPLPQHSVSVLRYVFDLHARHGAILALLAPKCKRNIGTLPRVVFIYSSSAQMHSSSGRCEHSLEYFRTFSPTAASPCRPAVAEWSPVWSFSAIRVPISHPKLWDTAVVHHAQLGVLGLLLGPDLLHVTLSRRSTYREGAIRVCSADNAALLPFLRCHHVEYASPTSHEGIGGDGKDVPAGLPVRPPAEPLQRNAH